ncbi:MAG TPA: lipopolysaccharide heptosyltransferase II [Vicinamibacterales bacterium]|jgi:heptosyltransferase-2|nr:lipopolysaccharide heptosyltransferase II [Vicinamibacterales bacterium]
MTTDRATTVTRIVIRPPNWLGDAVLALPAMSAVRRQYPDASITVAAAPAVAALFREETHVAPDQVIDLPRATRDAVAVLEGGGFDAGLLLPNSFRSAWQFWRGGVRERWGYATAGRGLLLTRRIRRPRGPGVMHQSDYYRALVRGLDVACDDAETPWIRPRPPSVDRAMALLTERGVPAGARLVGFAPGAAYGAAKQWPPDRVAAVLARIVQAFDVTAVVVGASHDRAAARAIESWLRAHAPDALARTVDLTGRTSLGALLGLMPRVAALLSNDSGAMHLAAAAGRPVVVVFGPTDERATGPIGDHDVMTEPVFCRPCQLRECPIDHRCMTRVSVDVVFAALAARVTAAGAAAR